MAKSNTKTSKKGTINKNPKKSNPALIIATVVILCLAVIIIVIFNNNNDGNVSSDTGTNNAADAYANDPSDSDQVQLIEEGGSLVIPVSEISTTAKFYPIEVDGTDMEIIAVEDSDGYIRTAFNTCQICYSSGKGYYVQSGNYLVCQNCGNRFTINQIEIESGGCNPWPIFAENKKVTEDSVEISYDFLKESKDIFANWKAGY